jgi:AraC-like DNA-binding protein
MREQRRHQSQSEEFDFAHGSTIRFRAPERLNVAAKVLAQSGYSSRIQPANDTPYQWLSVPQWYLWDGGFLLLGRAKGVVPAHAHHAIQFVVSFDQAMRIAGSDGNWREGSGILVRPDAVHSFDCNGAFGAMLFIDPESSEGAWLTAPLREDITIVPNARLQSAAVELGTFTEPPTPTDPASLIRHCVQALSPGPQPKRHLDPRINTVLGHIQASDDLRISLDTAAGMAFLSPSRFTHLFREQVGLPFSRYMLWRKLTRAMLAIGSERTMADAAQAADFADAAHLTRTFYQMVGMAPSALMRGTFTEVAPPFSGFVQPE